MTASVERNGPPLVFPRHGYVLNDRGKPSLVFPFVRAVWERGEASPDTPLRARTFMRMTHFQKTLVKVLLLLREISECERLIMSDKSSDGVPIGEVAPVFRARNILPMHLDLCFFYMRMLGDRFTIALGPLISKRPECFPQEYKKLAKAMRRGSFPTRWHVPPEYEGVREAICRHSGWYERISDLFCSGRPTKGVRDAIAHRLTQFSISTCHAEPEGPPAAVSVMLDGLDNDVPRVDALECIREIIGGFCELVSALPVALWQRHSYEGRDSFLGELGGPALTRFFPRLVRR